MNMLMNLHSGLLGISMLKSILVYMNFETWHLLGLFHNDFSPSGEQPQQFISAHKRIY